MIYSNSIATFTLLQFLMFPVHAWSQVDAETATETSARHRRVSERREGIHIICHRGASEAAHENTMEAYRAALDLGADGSEIDVRSTKDGVLISFHDDSIDNILTMYGDVSDYTWEELQAIPFRNPGRFGKYCRIPTVREVFEFHRDHAALIYLDVKRPNLTEGISKLLEELDMFDHIVYASQYYREPRVKWTRVSASLYSDRSEVVTEAIQATLKKPGKQIIVDEPRFVAAALGRKISTLSDRPVKDELAVWADLSVSKGSTDKRSLGELLRLLGDAEDWNVVATGEEAEAASAKRILQRAMAADELARRSVRSTEVFDALEECARHRSLHRSWRYCGLDGIAALRALVSLKAPQAVEVIRHCLWRDEAVVEVLTNPSSTNPRSWVDWQTKMSLFKLLESLPGSGAEQICRDYLALSDEEALRIGIVQFESAARTLLAISADEATLKELSQHRLSNVRGRVVLFGMGKH